METSGYYLDLGQFSLSKLKNHLQTTRLLPSQKVLLENINDRFDALEHHGIENMLQLQTTLRTKSEVQAFAEKIGISEDYLTILRREVNSYLPKPIALKDFPGVNPEAIERLLQIGVKNTLQLFPHVLSPDSRSEFAKQNQITEDDLLELTKLTDVARTRWVGPKFARLLVESGCDTVEKIANSDIEDLYEALMRTNIEKRIYQGKFGKEDMRIWVKTVQDVPLVIQY